MGIFGLFGRKTNEADVAKIQELEEKLLRKEEEVERLVTENDELKTELEKDKIVGTSQKQLEIIEKNVVSKQEEVNRLKKVLEDYRIPFKKHYAHYKVEIKKVFPEKKFDEVMNFFAERDCHYMSDFLVADVADEMKLLKHGTIALQRCSDYSMGRYASEVAIARNRGDKISKQYRRTKKLWDFLGDYYLEYMDDLDKFDLSVLKNYGFSEEEIAEVRETRDAYYAEYQEQ